MAVLSYREILPRTFSHKFGESPTAEIKYALTLDGATNTQEIIGAIGIAHGAAHPEYSYLLCHNGQVTETDRYHAEATYSYEVPKGHEYDANPLSRADIWSFSTGGISVPTFRYYNGDGNGDIKPLTNTAGDIIEGAQTIQGELRLSIAGNRATFPIADAVAVTGAVNSDSFLGALAHEWICNGISGQPATEVVNGAEVKYWQVTVELSYKAGGYKLYLPNAGWNYLEGSQLTRAYVIDDQTKERVASASVVKLTQGGAIQTSGDPIILERRVNPAVAFSSYFGTPPF
jgi:hypothetical protein